MGYFNNWILLQKSFEWIKIQIRMAYIRHLLWLSYKVLKTQKCLHQF